MKKQLFTIALFSALLVGLSACGSTIVMQDPKTQEIAQCDSNTFLPIHRSVSNENCAEAYEKAGWVRLTPDQK
jgi:hypothetical protein